MDGSLVVSLLAVALAAGSYVRQGALVLSGAYEDMPADHVKRELYGHLTLVVGAALVVMLARPFGVYSLALAPAGVVVAQLLFTQALLVAGFVRHRRSRDGGGSAA